MKPSQQKVKELSRKISIILKLGLIVSVVIMALALMAIGILLFSGEELKSSFLAAFEVTANNGTTIGIGPRPLLTMFAFMLVDTALISLAIFFVHAIFEEMKKGCTPFSRRNTVRIRKIALVTAVLGIVGSYSDALVDYYTHRGIDLAGQCNRIDDRGHHLQHFPDIQLRLRPAAGIGRNFVR